MYNEIKAVIKLCNMMSFFTVCDILHTKIINISTKEWMKSESESFSTTTAEKNIITSIEGLWEHRI